KCIFVIVSVAVYCLSKLFKVALYIEYIVHYLKRKAYLFGVFGHIGQTVKACASQNGSRHAGCVKELACLEAYHELKVFFASYSLLYVEHLSAYHSVGSCRLGNKRSRSCIFRPRHALGKHYFIGDRKSVV